MNDEIRTLPKGYDDTPVIPGQQWKVHDIKRPSPREVIPPTSSSEAVVGTVPSDAIVMFDGSSMDGWLNRRREPAEWLLVSGDAMEVVPGTGDISSKVEIGSCQLHVEWRAPAEIYADSQGRGNSGVFLMGLYEIQVLDGYENPTYADGLTAAIYGQHPPLLNACVPPGHWHTFDIVFEAPVFEAEKIQTPAFVTMFHNGLCVHVRQEIQGPTQHRRLANYDTPHGARGPLVLQDHEDKVQFRNIWVRELSRLRAE